MSNLVKTWILRRHGFIVPSRSRSQACRNKEPGNPHPLRQWSFVACAEMNADKGPVHPYLSNIVLVKDQAL